MTPSAVRPLWSSRRAPVKRRRPAARHPRSPIRTGKREALEVEFGLEANDAIDVKPDVGEQPIRVQVCAIRPAATSAASSLNAQRHPLPSYRARMASVAIRPVPQHPAASSPERQASSPVPQAPNVSPRASSPGHQSTPGVAPGSEATPCKPGRPPGSKSRPRILAVAT